MASYLYQIQSPTDLKKLNINEKYLLAEEIREFLLEKVSKTGGHLASNLGVVELTVALHSSFNTFHDKVVWDVGHQCYVHKMLTGRRDDFDSLRQYGGLSGFPKCHESIHDHFNTGHSATSLSAALGMATARDLKKDCYHVAAIIGDGALTGGMAFEALNHAGQSGTDFTVILNDNEMSIAENVGGLSNYLTRIRSFPVYSRLKEDLESFIGNFPVLGKSVYRTAEKAKDSIKYFFVPGVLFEELGFTYIGPIDGHSIEDVTEALNLAKRIKGPKVVHVLTVKGKGYHMAEKYPAKFHGIGSFDVITGKKHKPSVRDFSSVAGKALEKLAEKDERVMAITAAMPDGTGLNDFKDRYPNRLFDVGIAEQHAVTFAAGQAAAGLRPFFAVYSSFLQRAYDQLIHDVALQNLPVTFLVDRAGLVGNDGETHHGVFDISCLSAVPGLTIMSPSDENELTAMIQHTMTLDGPSLIRYPRGEAFKLSSECTPIKTGKGIVLEEYGYDFIIIALGSLNRIGLEILEDAKELGILGTLIDPRFVKPLDQELLLEYGKLSETIIVMEENQKIGGLGSLIQHTFNEHDLMKRVSIFALPDRFTEQGDMKSLYEQAGLSSKEIIHYIKHTYHKKCTKIVSIKQDERITHEKKAY
ncbi:1-deoxy-D-xylulose-5-phosphate synthase [Tindallia californiensis]|uniref:1-deoxy-D-xylulose-5-phosphate synthase n=1 Tax=Tindallia californiensis TaxID=159292 RepID=A0A1H3NK03_9FIRM|nr:1-deoxy-D-xylulose-5-phosphate synthase [Tindallia californiensis]SDY89277.1 1-deoxy-D-xylulose-5-phosphate synthase [Tindallia californiensis]